MSVTHISKKAFVTLAMCTKAQKPYGITVDPQGNSMKFVWAFKLKEEQAKREGYDRQQARGAVNLDRDFPGCPYCGCKQFVFCGRCGTPCCYHGEEVVTCPKCGNTSRVETVESIELKGGGL